MYGAEPERKLDGFYKSLDAADSLPELWRVALRFFRGRGFRGLSYYWPLPAPPGQKGRMAIIHHGFPREIAEFYLGRDAGVIDPVPAFAMAHGIPMRWGEIWKLIEPTAEQAAFRDRMRELGIGDGLALPVFGPRQRNAYVTIGHPVMPEVLEHADVQELHMAAQAAHMRYCALTPVFEPLEKPLSSREAEILTWVARGKSNGVIADILHLSAGTVDTYLRRIYDKLKVSDRTSAAVRGVGMGLITVN